jgi:hypothetical protein
MHWGHHEIATKKLSRAWSPHPSSKLFVLLSSMMCTGLRNRKSDLLPVKCVFLYVPVFYLRPSCNMTITDWCPSHLTSQAIFSFLKIFLLVYYGYAKNFIVTFPYIYMEIVTFPYINMDIYIYIYIYLPLPFFEWLWQVSMFHIHRCKESTSTIFTFLYSIHLPSPPLNMTCFTFLSFII